MDQISSEFAHAARRAALAFLPCYAVETFCSDSDNQALRLHVRDERGQIVYRAMLLLRGENPTTAPT